jgi:hypothetical protein
VLAYPLNSQKNEIESLYVLHIQSTSIVEDGEAVQVVCGAVCTSFNRARIANGQGSVLAVRLEGFRRTRLRIWRETDSLQDT